MTKEEIKAIRKELGMTQAEFVCRKCLHSDMADFNAALNIKKLGRQSTGLWSATVSIVDGQAPRL